MTATELAKAMNISERLAQYYLTGEKEVPTTRVVRFCKLTERPLQDVRPDLFGLGLRVVGESQ